MPEIKLYHRTTQEAIGPILAGGFRNGSDGLVWFSPKLDCWGEAGRHLLEVTLDLTDLDLPSFLVTGTSEEIWCDETQDFITDPDTDQHEQFEWYAIPADTLAGRYRCRHVLPLEVQSLMTDYIYDNPSPSESP